MKRSNSATVRHRKREESCKAIHIGIRYCLTEYVSLPHGWTKALDQLPDDVQADSRGAGAGCLFCSAFAAFSPPRCSRRTGSRLARAWAWRKCAWRFRTSSPRRNDPQNAALLKTFNDTLWNDLDVSGVVELVSKSFYPLQVPGQPPEVNFLAWNAPPPNAAHAGVWKPGRRGRKAHGSRLAVRREEHPVAAGSGQAVFRYVQRCGGAGDGAQVRRRDHLPAGRRHSRALPRRRFISSATGPGTRKSGRWTTTARTSTRSRIWARFRCRRGFRPTGRASPSAH